MCTARILIAEDDDDIRSLVALKLRREGHEVLEARDGEEALGLALEHTPDLVVLDFMMPKLDGHEVTRRLREHESTREMAVLLLTARAGEGEVERALEAGVDAHLAKPFGLEELRSRIEELLGR